MVVGAGAPDTLARLGVTRQALVGDKTGLLWEVVLGQKTFLKFSHNGLVEPWRYYAEHRHPAPTEAPVVEELSPARVAEIDTMVDASVCLLQWMYLPARRSETGDRHAYQLQPCLPTMAVYVGRPPEDARLEMKENIRVRLTWLGATVGVAAACYPIFAWWVSAAYALGGAAAVRNCCTWSNWVPVNKAEVAHQLPEIEIDADADRVRYYYDNGYVRRATGPSADDPLASLAADPYAWIRDRAAYRATHSFADL